MVKNYLEFHLDENQSLFVEWKEEAGKADRVKEDAPGLYNRAREFGEAVAVIRPLVDKVLKPLTTLEQKPKRVELQFGFSIGSNNEVILKQDAKEAHIKVNLLFEP